ncbi:hypothetical protein KCP71_17260 [Salmonella enterica subsp. enterica]|nr:hypothetical protein KCP71_17260 [Salmonella enterica subsp. enterica]
MFTFNIAPHRHGAAGGDTPSALWILPRFQPFLLFTTLRQLNVASTRIIYFDGRAYTGAAAAGRW